jgi:serine/threonine protein kinase
MGKPKLLEESLREINTLQQLSKQPECNPYITCYYGSHFDQATSKLYIEMEYAGMTSDRFADYLREKSDRSTLIGYIVDVLRSIASALEYIHLQDIIHRDIKPVNILISEVGQAKLADFGLACHMLPANDDRCAKVKEECCPGLAGTPLYLAPEVYTSRISVPASDVWSLGVSLYYLYYNVSIWSSIHKGSKYNRGQLEEIINSQYPQTMNTNNQRLDSLVNAMTVKNYKDRISVNSILSKF